MKKIIIAFIVVGIFLILYLSIGGFPIVFNNQNSILNCQKIAIGKCNPLEDIDFNIGNNKVVLLLSFDDIHNLPEKILRRKVLACYDNKVLQQLKNKFDFEINDGDMATVNSEIIVFKNNKIVLKTNIVLDKNLIGIQDKKTGWMEANNKEDLYIIFSQFKPYRKVFLNCKAN